MPTKDGIIEVKDNVGNIIHYLVCFKGSTYECKTLEEAECKLQELQEEEQEPFFGPQY